MRTGWIGFGLAIGLTMALAADTAAPGYQRSIAEWRAQQEAKLKAEDGWLTVVGLTWLKEGAKQALAAIPGTTDVNVELTFDPAWSPAMLSEIARRELGVTS